MTAGIGHNSGKSLEGGHSWRKHVWTKARKELLPVLPIEVVRRRVKRAKDLGLPYRTYAGLRASNGHDLIGFLFSTNALRVFRRGQELPLDRSASLGALKDCRRIALTHPPLSPQEIECPLEGGIAAPSLLDGWSTAGRNIRLGLKQQMAAPGQIVLIAETGLEHEWAEAARLAGVISGDRFFSGRV